MRGFGYTLLLFAIGSALLPLVGVQFILMMWVDMWGTTIGWVIRGAMAVLGIVLVVVGEEE
jgi:hypothetical protein